MSEPVAALSARAGKSRKPEHRDVPYVEFAVASNFSFLHGASHPEQLMRQAASAEVALAGLGLCDRNTVAGVVRAHLARRENDLKLRYHPGARLVFADGTPDILAYPRDRAGWGRLCRLLTRGNLRAEKGDCILTLDDLLDHAEGLELVVMPEATREEPARFLHRSRTFFGAEERRQVLGAAPRADWLAALREAAPGRVRFAAAMLYRGNDRARLAARAQAAREAGIPLIAVNDVLYHHFEQRPLQDVLTCIRRHLTIDTAGRKLAANAERYLKPGAEMARLFRAAPEAIAETLRLSEALAFSLDELRYEYPDESVEGFASAQEALEHLTWEGARTRFPDGIGEEVRASLANEFALIAGRDYAAYFLTVHDIVRFARSRGILCQGRGSAANSTVCYCLGITSIDPVREGLLFERFISTARDEPPDIDVDFEHERREEVIQYVYEKYSRARTGIAATVISYRGRSAIREIGKAFALSEDMIGALASSIWGMGGGRVRHDALRAAGLDPESPRVTKIIALANAVQGFPRHLSQHVGGFVITRSRLDEVVPIMNGGMEARTHIEWDKDDLDALGILKVDVLGLGMLTCLRRALDLLARHYPQALPAPENRALDLADIPAEEPAVYRMLQRADSIGVFQVESRAQMSMLPRLKPKEFYDLVIEVAIVRPGPIQGDMVHPYLRRRQGSEEVEYPSPELEAVLGKTLGVPLFQEQAMKIAIVAGGFTPAEADRLRRAMATFKRTGTIGNFRDKMIAGMLERGYTRDFAQRCFSQIEGFGEYGFPESHAASFALLVYASAWLKCRYPDVFAAALLNAQPMGFYAPAQIVRDAREHGVEVRPPDINASDYDMTLEPGPCAAARLNALHRGMERDVRASHALRLGLRAVKGLSEDDARLIAARRTVPYVSIRDLWLRTQLAPRVLERLADADAFGSLDLSRRQALWTVKALGRAGDQDDLPLLVAPTAPDVPASEPAPPADFREPAVALPAMPLGEEVVNDYRFLSLSLRAHPASFLRGDLARRGVMTNATLRDLPSGAPARVSGLVTVRQRPGSAKGVVFMTIEDETAIANIIVWPPVFERFRAVAMGARYVAATGRVQAEAGVIHVVAERLDDLTPLLARLSEDAPPPEPLARADAVKHPQHPHAEDRCSPRAGGRAPTRHPRHEAARIAADLGVHAPGSAHAPTRRG
jgi:error-prone DNA polymerase